MLFTFSSRYIPSDKLMLCNVRLISVDNGMLSVNYRCLGKRSIINYLTILICSHLLRIRYRSQRIKKDCQRDQRSATFS